MTSAPASPGESQHAPEERSPASLGAEEVHRIAELARLRIEPAEVPALVEHFSRMLRFVDSLAEADDPSLPPWQLESASAETLRADRPREPGEPGGPIPAEAWRANAPESDGAWFTVPRVVG